AGFGGLLTARQKAAGGRGVGVGEGAVDVGGVGTEGLAAGEDVVGGGGPVGGLPGGDGAEAEDEGGEESADDAEAAGFGGGGVAGRVGAFREGGAAGRGGGGRLRRCGRWCFGAARLCQCHLTSPMVIRRGKYCRWD